MDKAKAQMVVEAGLKQAHCCATCGNWTASRRGFWGTCGEHDHEYEHGKHRRTHKMPAPVYGTCGDWTQGDDHGILTFLVEAKIVAEGGDVVVPTARAVVG